MKANWNQEAERQEKTHQASLHEEAQPSHAQETKLEGGQETPSTSRPSMSSRLSFHEKLFVPLVEGRHGSAPMSLMIARFLFVLQLLLAVLLPLVDVWSVQQLEVQTKTGADIASAALWTSLCFSVLQALLWLLHRRGWTAKVYASKRAKAKRFYFVASQVLSLFLLLVYLLTLVTALFAP